MLMIPIHGIVACQCASSIAGIRLSMCKGDMSATALGALVDAQVKLLFGWMLLTPSSSKIAIMRHSITPRGSDS